MRGMTRPARIDERLARALDPVEPGSRIAVAVSGGGDSIALLHLIREWGAARGITPEAMTVDHRLRAESAAETAWVAAQCAALDIPHHSLVWQKSPDHAGNLSAAARDARYALMGALCRERGIFTLMTAHTEGDQAETVLMRMARGSGVDGLAAIPRQSDVAGIRVIRPLLDVSRSELRAWLTERGIEWLEDPTNDDARFDRVKARQALEVLAGLGFRNDRLARMADAMRDARQVLDEAAVSLSARAVEASPLGYFRLRRAEFAAAPRETAHRLLTGLMQALSGAVYRPRRAALDAFAATLSGEADGPQVLQGCRLVLSGESAALIREFAACPPSRPLAGHPARWDSRFSVRFEADAMPGTMTLAPLGEAGWAQIARHDAPEMAALREAPFAARLALPSIWREENVVAIPVAGLVLDPAARFCVIEPLPPFSGAAVDPVTNPVMY